MSGLPTRRRLATLLLALVALLVVAAGLVWRWKVPALVRHKLELATGRRVTLASVGLTWRLQVVVEDVQVMGAPPYERQAAARLDRVVVHLHGPRGLLSPSQILVDGADLDYRATAEGDNLRGPAAARTREGSGVRNGKAELPRITLRNARLHGSIALPHLPVLAMRAPEIEVTRDGAGHLTATMRGLTVDAEGLASFHAAQVSVEGGSRQALAWTATGVALATPGGGRLLQDLRVKGSREGAQGSFEARSPEGEDPRVDVTATWNAESAEITANLHQLPVRPLGVLARGRLLGLDHAKAEVVAHATIDRPALRADFDLDARLAAFDLLHPAIDTQPWRNQTLALVARGHAGVAPFAIEITDGSVKAMGATLKLRANVEDLHSPRGSITVFTPPHQPLACPSLLFAQPAPVQRALDGLELQGNLGLALSLTFDASAWEDLQLDVTLDPLCTVKRDARVLADLLPVLRNPKQAPPPGFAKVALGNYNPDFVPLAHMPVHLPSAFITSEDSKFFHHRGFDLDMIRRALAQDLANRSVERGASTITQQLAKNLFLTHRRTLARKLEEAVLTWRLQKLLTKDRVLELYLNVIELGPGIRGVKQAARRYFGKEVSELVPMESAHLAALTPNPHVLARRFHDGQVDEGWQERLYDLLGMMKRHHRLSAEELAAARASKLELRDLSRDHGN